MHNKLRREIAALLTIDNCYLDPYFVKLTLERALEALGGPVEDNRPVTEAEPTKAPVEPMPALEQIRDVPPETNRPCPVRWESLDEIRAKYPQAQADVNGLPINGD